MDNSDSRVPGLARLIRPEFCFAVLLLGICASCSQVEEPKAKAEKFPNIVFIFADDQSWPHASAYGDVCLLEIKYSFSRSGFEMKLPFFS